MCIRNRRRPINYFSFHRPCYSRSDIDWWSFFKKKILNKLFLNTCNKTHLLDIPIDLEYKLYRRFVNFMRV